MKTKEIFIIQAGSLDQNKKLTNQALEQMRKVAKELCEKQKLGDRFFLTTFSDEASDKCLYEVKELLDENGFSYMELRSKPFSKKKVFEPRKFAQLFQEYEELVLQSKQPVVFFLSREQALNLLQSIVSKEPLLEVKQEHLQPGQGLLITIEEQTIEAFPHILKEDTHTETYY